MHVVFVNMFVKREAERTAAVSHNHPEGIKGAVVTAVCIWMAKHDKTKDEIYDYAISQYPADKYKFSIDKDSPILLGIPDAEILSFDSGEIHPIEYEDTDSYKITEMFINSREQILKRLLG